MKIQAPAHSGIKDLYVLNDQLVIGGDFYIPEISRYNIVVWDTSVNSITPLDSIPLFNDNHGVNSIISYKNNLFLGGSYKKLQTGSVVFNIIRYKNNSWEDVNGGVWYDSAAPVFTGNVKDMVLYNDKLIVGGGFNYAGGVSIRNIASWDGNKWEDIGSTIYPFIRTLCIYNDELYAGSNLGIIKYGCPCDSTDHKAGFYQNYSTLDLKYNNKVQFTDNVTNPGTFEWHFGDGTTDSIPNPEHTYTSPGIYTVVLKTGNGCCRDVVTSTVEVVDTRLEIKDNINNNTLDVNVYPNPTDDYINIEFSTAQKDKYQLDLYTIKGVPVYHKEKNVNSFTSEQINVSSMPRGLYLLQVRSESNVIVKKVVVR